MARVGSGVITLAAFNLRLQSTMTALQQGGATTNDPAMVTDVRASVLRSLILDAIIAQEAAARGIAATPAEVQAAVAADARQDGGINSLATHLAEVGGSIAQLQDEIRSQINEQRLENVFAQARAADVERQLAAGTSFASLARSMSDDTGTSGKGGDLGVITASQLGSYDTAFISAVKALPAGRYTTTPVHDAGGYDVVEVYARTATSWSVRHILIAAPTPYTVRSRPAWFGEALFATVAQLCTQNQIHVYIGNAGSNPCSGAPRLTPGSSPSPG